MSLANQIKYAIQQIGQLEGYNLNMLTNSQLLQVGLLRSGANPINYQFPLPNFTKDLVYIPYPDNSGSDWNYLPAASANSILLVNPSNAELEIKMINPQGQSLFLAPLELTFFPVIMNANQILLRRKDQSTTQVPVLYALFGSQQ